MIKWLWRWIWHIAHTTFGHVFFASNDVYFRIHCPICFFLKLVLIVSCLTRVGNGNECEIPMTKWRWLRRHIINRNSCQMRTRRLSLSVCTISLLSHMYVSGISPKYAQTMVSWMRVVGGMGALRTRPLACTPLCMLSRKMFDFSVSLSLPFRSYHYMLMILHVQRGLLLLN